MAFYKISFSD